MEKLCVGKHNGESVTKYIDANALIKESKEKAEIARKAGLTALAYAHDLVVMYLKNAEEANVVELPCKVGDKIYDIGEFVRHEPHPMIYEDKVFGITVAKDDKGETVFEICCTEFYKEDFGKTVFTSEEEAYAALKRLGEEEEEAWINSPM